jgi:hypothetical protein
VAPTLVASYPVYANAQNLTTLTTPSFTPSVGEVLVVKLSTWLTSTSMSAPTGGSQTFTSALIVAPGGFNAWVGVYFATVSGSPGAMTVSSTPSATSWHSMVVERWSGAQVAVTPAVNATVTGVSTAPTATVTTTAANSVVTWVDSDAQSVSPTGHTYNSTSGTVTEDGIQDGSVGANGVTYHAWQTAVTAGAQTIGMTAPTTQKWVMAGMEVKASGGGPTPVSGSDTATATDAVTARSASPGTESGAGTDAGSVAAATSAADTASGADTGTISVTLPGAETGSGAEAVTALTVSLPSADPAAGVDATQAFTAVTSSADTASGADTASLVAGASGADTGTASDAATLTVAVSSTDTATAVENAPAVALNTADTAGAAESAAPAANLPAADTASGAESATVALAGSDTATGTDAGAPFAALTGSDAGAGVEASPSTALAGFDAASAADTLSLLRATPAGTDTATAADNGTVDTGSGVVNVSGADIATGVESATLAASPTGVDTATAAETVALLATLTGGDTAVGADVGAVSTPGAQPFRVVVVVFADAPPRWVFVALPPRWDTGDAPAKWVAQPSPPKWELAEAPMPKWGG